ncbi:MAG TPA: DinB family protein, partial [Vicinamibacterales bacterium]|nr:DinB family protein [Vicinamibacterales bacterium]
MTYYGGKELANAFRTVRKNTIQIAQDIPEDKYDFKPSPDSRSVKQTLAHIATLTTFPMMLHGERIPIEKIDFMEYMKNVGEDEARLQTKAQ